MKKMQQINSELCSPLVFIALNDVGYFLQIVQKQYFACVQPTFNLTKKKKNVQHTFGSAHPLVCFSVNLAKKKNPNPRGQSSSLPMPRTSCGEFR